MPFRGDNVDKVQKQIAEFKQTRRCWELVDQRSEKLNREARFSKLCRIFSETNVLIVYIVLVLIEADCSHAQRQSIQRCRFGEICFCCSPERPSPWRHTVRANPENSALDLQNLTVAWKSWNGLGGA